jgi:hypothetical protein
MAFRRPPPWALTLASRVVLALAVLALLVGAAVWLGTPTIRVGGPDGSGYASSPLQSYAFSKPQEVISAFLLSAIGAALLPLVQPRQLLQNWLHPTRWYHPWLFRFAGAAVLVGIPFVLIVFLARHNFSGAHADRSFGLSMTTIHFNRWIEFWGRIREEERPRGGPAALGQAPTNPSRFVWEQVKAAGDPGIVALLRDPADPRNLFLETCPIPFDDAHWVLKKLIVDLLNTRVIGYLDVNGHPVAPVPEFARAVLASRDGAWFDAVVGPHPQHDRIRLLVTRLHNDTLVHQERVELNRLLFEACYPQEVWPAAIIRRQEWVPNETKTDFVQLIDRDQQLRWSWLVGCLIVFAFAAVLVNLNFTSLHGYYRDRLREAFLTTRAEGRQTLTTLNTTDHGGPYHLICATYNRLINLRELLFAKRLHLDAGTTQGFVFSRRLTGTGAAPAPTDGSAYRDWPLDEAMAVSGAALSPVRTGNSLVVFLMTVLNLRLGQWLPNPNHPPRLNWPCVGMLLLDLLRRPENRRFLFVTDGGHHDNLGLWPLLQRRCRILIVSDASADPDYVFADLLRIYRRARLGWGVRFRGPGAGGDVLPLDLLRPGSGRSRNHPTPEPLGPSGPDDPPRDGAAEAPPTGGLPLSEKHYLLARVTYPRADGAEEEGFLVYLKPTMTGDEENDLSGHRINHSEFPHDTTADQLFEEDQFESYRQLGYHIGEKLCLELLQHSAEAEEKYMWTKEFCLEAALERWEYQLRAEQALRRAAQARVGNDGRAVPTVETEVLDEG